MRGPSHRSSDPSDAAGARDRRGTAGATSLTFPPGASVSSLREAVWGFRLYRTSFVVQVAVGATWPLLFPFLAAASRLAAIRMAGPGAFDGVPVVVVALASGAPKLAMMVALASGLAFARSSRGAGILAVALCALGVGLLADAATLAVPFAESAALAERAMWERLPAVAVLSGGASLSLVTGVIGRIARSIDAPRMAGRARRVQALALAAVFAGLGALAAGVYLPAQVATALGVTSVGAGLAAVVLHVRLAADMAAALEALVEQKEAVTPVGTASEGAGRARWTARRTAPGLVALAASCALATGIALVHRRQAQRNVLLLRAVDVGPAVVAERCGDPRAKLPITPLEASHQTDDSETDPILTLTAKGDVFHRHRLVGRVSGACVLDPRGGVLVSVDAHGLLSGPGGEPLGAFKAVETLKESGATVTVGEVLVGPEGGMTGVANSGSVYFVAPPPYGAGQGSGEEASSLPAEVTGEVPRARRTALLLDSLIGRLDPNDR